MRYLIDVLRVCLLIVCIAIGVVTFRLASIADAVAVNHIVEKGNGAAWPVKITALLGEVSKTSDSVRLSANSIQSLLAQQAPQTATAVTSAANALSATSNQISSLVTDEGPKTARAVAEAASGLAGTSRTVQSILANDGPATAKSVRDAAAALSATAERVNKIVDDEAPATAESIRRAADTAQKVLSEEGPATAASIRDAVGNADKMTGSWASISASLDAWVARMTAPPTTKTKILAAIHAALIFLAHWLG